MPLVLPSVRACLPEPSVSALPVHPSLRNKYKVQRQRCLVAAPLHKGLPGSIQKLAALVLFLLMWSLRKSCKGANGQRQYLSHMSASGVLVSQIERYSKAGRIGQQKEENEKEEEGSRPVL